MLLIARKSSLACELTIRLVPTRLWTCVMSSKFTRKFLMYSNSENKFCAAHELSCRKCESFSPVLPFHTGPDLPSRAKRI